MNRTVYGKKPWTADFEFYLNCVDRFWDSSAFPSLFALRDNDKERFNSFAIRDAWRRMIKDGASGCVGGEKSFDFYLGIPFCEHICNFCAFFPEKLQDRKQLDEYIVWLLDYFHFFASTFSEIVFSTLLVGGGTPSILDINQMERLFSELFERFRFAPKGEKHFEFHPMSCSKDKLRLLRDFGFNAITIGAQSLDMNVLKRINRLGQSNEQVESAVLAAKKCTFPYGVSVDLMMGVDGDTSQSFLRSFHGIAALQPDSITVWVLKPVRPYAVWSHEEILGRYSQKQGGRAEVSSLVENMFSIAERFKYNVRQSHVSNYTYEFRLTPEGADHPCCAEQGIRGISTFGLGAMSRSCILGSLTYTCDPLRKPFDPDAQVFSGQRIDPYEGMLRYLATNIMGQSSYVSESQFQNVFGRSLCENFGPALEKLARWGLVKLDRNGASFLSADMKEKAACVLSLVGRNRLRRQLDAYVSPENQVRLSLPGVKITVWIERVRRNQKYAARFGYYGLSINRASSLPFGRTEGALHQYLTLLFKKICKEQSFLSGPEKTFLLYEKIGLHLQALRDRSAAKLELKPWIYSLNKSGLSFADGAGYEGVLAPGMLQCPK